MPLSLNKRVLVVGAFIVLAGIAGVLSHRAGTADYAANLYPHGFCCNAGINCRPRKADEVHCPDTDYPRPYDSVQSCQKECGVTPQGKVKKAAPRSASAPTKYTCDTETLAKLTFKPQRTDSRNWGKLGEKWLVANGDWYFIRPDGGFYKWGGIGPDDKNPTMKLTDNACVLQLDPAFYSDPHFLDPEKSMILNWQKHCSALASADDAAALPNRGQCIADVPQYDCVDAETALSNIVFKYNSSDHINWGGQNEKWIDSQQGWYFILPNGDLYHWNNDSNNLLTSPKVATFPAAFYDDPFLLDTEHSLFYNWKKTCKEGRPAAPVPVPLPPVYISAIKNINPHPDQLPVPLGEVSLGIFELEIFKKNSQNGLWLDRILFTLEHRNIAFDESAFTLTIDDDLHWPIIVSCSIRDRESVTRDGQTVQRWSLLCNPHPKGEIEDARLSHNLTTDKRHTLTLDGVTKRTEHINDSFVQVRIEKINRLGATEFGGTGDTSSNIRLVHGKNIDDLEAYVYGIPDGPDFVGSTSYGNATPVACLDDGTCPIKEQVCDTKTGKCMLQYCEDSDGEFDAENQQKFIPSTITWWDLDTYTTTTQTDDCAGRIMWEYTCADNGLERERVVTSCSGQLCKPGIPACSACFWVDNVCTENEDCTCQNCRNALRCNIPACRADTKLIVENPVLKWNGTVGDTDLIAFESLGTGSYALDPRGQFFALDDEDRTDRFLNTFPEAYYSVIDDATDKEEQASHVVNWRSCDGYFDITPDEECVAELALQERRPTLKKMEHFNLAGWGEYWFEDTDIPTSLDRAYVLTPDGNLYHWTYQRDSVHLDDSVIVSSFPPSYYNAIHRAEDQVAAAAPIINWRECTKHKAAPTIGIESITDANPDPDRFPVPNGSWDIGKFTVTASKGEEGARVLLENIAFDVHFRDVFFEEDKFFFTVEGTDVRVPCSVGERGIRTIGDKTGKIEGWVILCEDLTTPIKGEPGISAEESMTIVLEASSFKPPLMFKDSYVQVLLKQTEVVDHTEFGDGSDQSFIEWIELTPDGEKTSYFQVPLDTNPVPSTSYGNYEIEACKSDSSCTYPHQVCTEVGICTPEYCTPYAPTATDSGYVTAWDMSTYTIKRYDDHCGEGKLHAVLCDNNYLTLGEITIDCPKGCHEPTGRCIECIDDDVCRDYEDCDCVDCVKEERCKPTLTVIDKNPAKDGDAVPPSPRFSAGRFAVQSNRDTQIGAATFAVLHRDVLFDGASFEMLFAPPKAKQVVTVSCGVASGTLNTQTNVLKMHCTVPENTPALVPGEGELDVFANVGMVNASLGQTSMLQVFLTDLFDTDGERLDVETKLPFSSTRYGSQ